VNSAITIFEVNNEELGDKISVEISNETLTVLISGNICVYSTSTDATLALHNHSFA
jgi:hypothetical protein